MSETLKACECGYLARLVITLRGRPKGSHLQVRCFHCGRRGPFAMSEAEATAAWNTRPDDGVREALVEFGKHRNWELVHKHPLYDGDDDHSEYWAVYMQIGPINDREWDLIGRGETPEDAIKAASYAVNVRPQGEK